MMKFYSTISIVASMLYLFVGFSVYFLNKKSKLCKIFLALNISMFVWSFAYSFAYLAVNTTQFSFWNKISAFGWCTFSSLILYLILAITENRYIHYWLVKFLVFLPSPVFLFMALFLFGPNIVTPPVIESFFYTGNFLYNFLFLLISIILLFLWGVKSDSVIQKKQAHIIVITSSIPFILDLITQTILPLLGINTIPSIGQIYSLIMLWGVYHAITRYQFMVIPTSLVTKELFNELSGLTFLVNASGLITKANKQSYNLLSYKNDEFINVPITSILKDERITEISKNYNSLTVPLKFHDIYVSSKTGEDIPFDISITPLFESRTRIFLGLLVIGLDIRTTKTLESEIVNHKLTNIKLKNSEQLFSTILEIIPFSILLSSRNDHKILYANNESSVFFKVSGHELIGSDARSYYKNPDLRNLLLNDIEQNVPVKDRENLFVQKDGNEVVGLVSMVSAIYLDQEVALSCINNVTEQRKLQQIVATSEKRLKELMHSIPDMVIVTDIHGTITFGNTCAYTVFFSEPDRPFLSENIVTLLSDEDVDRGKENIIKILSYNPGPVEYKSTRKDGTLLNLEVIGTVLYDDKNTPIEVIYVARDITERKAAEEKLLLNSKEIERMNIELLELNTIFKNKSIRDGLTNLYNHQHINDLLEQEIKKTSPSSESLCVMMLDIDYFKRVNDTYGHPFGDRVLVIISNLILENVRSSDLVGRYGGEEFITILPDITLEEAYQIAERIRKNIHEYDFSLPNFTVTVSAGIALYNSEDVKTFVNRADTLLYQAKRNGRNRVEFAL